MEERLKQKEWLSDKELAMLTPLSAFWYQKQRSLANKGLPFAGPSWQRFGNRCFYHRTEVEKYFSPVQKKTTP